MGRQKSEGCARRCLMAVMEAQQWCDKPENSQEMSEIVGKRQWFNVPGRRHHRPSQGRHQLRQRPRREGHQAVHEVLEDHASYPFKSHDTWFVTEDIRWGKFEPGTDIKALVDKVNREDIWREAAKALGVAAADIPASSVARQGDLLRRQGVRSGQSARPISRACRSSASRSDDRCRATPRPLSPRRRH